MEFNILTYNNGVGIVTDALLLKQIIDNNITNNTKIIFLNNQPDFFGSDCGIWIQNFNINLLNRYKKNIFFINEEWAGNFELNNLYLFDYVICKSKYIVNYLKKYCNPIYLPFISKNLNNDYIVKNKKFLHFVGRSIQKNTELVLNQTLNITLLDPYNRYKPSLNFNHINVYQTEDQLNYILNHHGIHICCSLYESWGHYLFEGLSTGAEIICSDIPSFREQLDPDLVHFISTIKKTNLNYEYDLDNIDEKFPLRKSFYVNVEEYNYVLNNLSVKGTVEKRKSLYRSIMNKNSKQLINFLKNI